MATIKLATVEKRVNGEEYLKIVFPFNFKDLENVKSIPERKYHGENNVKFWSAPNTEETRKLLQGWGFQIDTDNKKEPEKMRIENISPISIPSTGKNLYPYQNIGVAFIEKKNGRALIADEMGLGKTCQALSWLQLHPEKRKAIIITPATLKINWQREAKMWISNPKTQVLTGSKIVPIFGEIIIINYDILAAWEETLIALKPQVIILDECHYIKSHSTRRTKAVKRICKGVSHVICLSGTPIVNRPIEMYNAINLIDSNIFPSEFAFAHKFCNPKKTPWGKSGWDFSGASNTEVLHKILVESIMIRRKKMDVLTELPPKTFSFVPMMLDNRKEYEFVKNNFIDWVYEQKGMEAAERAGAAECLGKIEGLKQTAVKGKMEQVLNWIEDFLMTGEKLVLFATHKTAIERIMEEFQNVAVKIDGSVSQAQRQIAVDKFQNDPEVKLFVGNIQAAGVGITLTASSNVAFMELPWTPGALAQASDRVHRIGQKDNVTVHYLLAYNTIEEEIAEMLDRKLKVLDSVLDGKDSDENSLLSELMKKYYAENRK